MVKHLTHYYKRDAPPFQTLSALPPAEARRIMETLKDDSPLFSRFHSATAYMEQRMKVEEWLRVSFQQKGGRLASPYPLYAVLGSSEWIERYAAVYNIGAIHIPLSLFAEEDVSFTYPDSMVSYGLGQDKGPAYRPALHGRVFTRTEVLALLEEMDQPVAQWNTGLADDVAPYLEAQIWKHAVVQGLIPSH